MRGTEPRHLAAHPSVVANPEPFHISAQMVDEEGVPVVAGTSGKIAKVVISGSLKSKVDFFDRIFGGASSYGQIQAAVAAADASSADITLVVMDSGGGEVVGMDQTAAALRAASNRTAVWANRAFSAAYGIASGADVIGMPKDGQVGSLSAFVLQADSSKAAEMEGVEVLVHSPDALKGAFVPGAPINKEARAGADALAVKLKQGFAETIAAGPRGLSLKDLEPLMKAQDFTAAEALEAGLVDQIHNTEAEFIAALLKNDTEDATMADTPEDAAAASPDAATPTPPASPPPAPEPAADRGPDLAAVLAAVEGLGTQIGALDTRMGAMEASNASASLRERIEATGAVGVDEKVTFCASLTPELQDAAITGYAADVKAYGNASGFATNLFDQEFDLKGEDGEPIEVTAGADLGMDPGQVDPASAVVDARCSAFASKGRKAGTREWNVAYRQEWERQMDAQGDTP